MYTERMLNSSAMYNNAVVSHGRVSADPVEALESELTELAGHLNAGNYRFLKLLAEFERVKARGRHAGG